MSLGKLSHSFRLKRNKNREIDENAPTFLQKNMHIEKNNYMLVTENSSILFRKTEIVSSSLNTT